MTDSTYKCYEEKINRRILCVFVILLIALGGAVEGFMSHSVKLCNAVNCILPATLLYYSTLVKIQFSHWDVCVKVLALITLLQVLIFNRYGTNNILVGRYYDIIIAFVLLRSLGIERFFFYFETSVALLTRISLFLWGVCILLPWLRTLLETLSFPIGFNTCGFTWGFVGLPSITKANEGIFMRNLGFAWEPGRFSSILVVTMMIHLFRHRFQLFQKNFWPLLGGILTTQSTTGYMALSVCLLGVMLNGGRSASSRFLKYVLCVFFIVVLFVSPFMLEKIKVVADESHFLSTTAVERMTRTGEKYVPQRVEGMLMEFLNIIDSPWIGYGDEKEKSYICRELFPTIDIALSNGIFQIIAMLGIPMGILIYMVLYRSSRLLARQYQVKGDYLFFLVICAVNVSYNFFVEPLFLVIVLYAVFRLEPDCESMASRSADVPQREKHKEETCAS